MINKKYKTGDKFLYVDANEIFTIIDFKNSKNPNHKLNPTPHDYYYFIENTRMNEKDKIENIYTSMSINNFERHVKEDVYRFLNNIKNLNNKINYKFLND